MLKVTHLVNFIKFQEKSAFLTITAQAFEDGDFLDTFLKFWVF